VLRWTERDELDQAWVDGLLGAGAIFELVTEDVLGRAVEVFAQRPRSVPEILERAAVSHGDRPYLIGADRVVTFAEAPTLARRVAEILADRYGVRPGDRVALCGSVTLEHALAVWGVCAAGAVATTLNPSWVGSEMAQAITLTGPVLALGDPDALDRLGAAGVATAALTELLDAADASPTSPLGAGSAPSRPSDPAATIDEDDPFAIVFTSGTTGRPKGATLSHRNAVHFSLAAAAASAVHSIIHALPGPGANPPTVIAASPLFHVSGLLGQLTNGAFWGMSVVLPPPGRWDETAHLELSERHRVTSWSIVPTQLWRLVEHPEIERFDLTALEVIGGGGATFSPDLLRRTAEQLPHAATALRVGYGMTETAGTVTMLQPPVPPRHRGSVGTPVAGTEIEIRGPEGDALPDGDIGQIWARGAQVFLGYWNDEAATESVLDAGRWYATGDFGRVDEGYLHLESRLRDLIIRGGENIYPIEIENRLVEHPAIAEAAVVGVAHPTLGQEVKAVCVLRAGHSLTAQEVRDWVAAAHARYKVPTIVEFRDDLPRNDVGKVLKTTLVD
jgi:acyl-CoA synthetase (AMP-forming)/AMP-acid ligase II